ncbi:MAG TPA: hypothetical protein VGI33_12645 [Paenibacillus sp.]|jgi:hypothetical protein
MVDENAIDNYEKNKQEFELGAKEVQDARSLLQQLEDSRVKPEIINTQMFQTIMRLNLPLRATSASSLE